MKSQHKYQPIHQETVDALKGALEVPLQKINTIEELNEAKGRLKVLEYIQGICDRQ